MSLIIIVESPTKAHTIERLLGQGYKVLSSYGHIRDLPKSELGIDVENDFRPKYIIPIKSRKVITLLKNESGKAEIVILATDEDREGEAIAWHLVQALGLNEIKNQKLKIKNYQRIVFHEITKSAIENALKNPRDIDLNLVDAQQARRILDRIVGYKLSPFLWKKVARGLSAGRVQSVAVRLAVEREREIQNFIPQEYWSIEALLQKILNSKSDHSPFPMGWVAQPLLKGCGEILNKSQIPNPKSQTEFKTLLVKKDGNVIPKLGIKTKEEAERIVKDLEGAEYRVINVEKKEVKRNPLPPFTTSTLQQEAWKRFHFPAKFTMRIAQQLYETGKITYHRTDSLNLSDLSLFAAKKFIIDNFGKNYWAGFLRKYKAKGRVQEAHEAIRPTYPDETPESLKLQDNQFKLYGLIWQRFIACQMSQASFDSTVVEIETGNPKSQAPNSKQIPNSKIQIQNKYTFRTTGQVLKFDGFLKVYPTKIDEAKASSPPFAKARVGDELRSSPPFAKARVFEENELPLLNINEILELTKLIPSQHFTQPPPRYNEATLIKILEQNGIGRPSTYAPIISVIQERNYIEKDEQKRFRPTEIGTVVNNLLVNHFPKIVDIKFTAEMEENLDEIAKGKRKWVKVVKEFYTPFEENLKKKYQEVSKKDITEIPTEKICPKCGAPLLIRLGKFGRFYACSRFPKCKYTESLKENTLGIKCPKCKEGGIVEKRTRLRQGFGGRRKIFYGCSNWPKCDFALWDKPTGEICPKCKSLLIKTKRAQIKCSSKECDYKVEK